MITPILNLKLPTAKRDNIYSERVKKIFQLADIFKVELSLNTIQ